MATVSLRSSEGRWVMVATILASAMAFIDGTALNVVLPSLQQSLHASGPDLFWILNAYLLMLAALILMGGSMGDRLGRKRVFMWGIVIFMAGSAASGLAQGVISLVLFRALQGVGGALMIPGSLSLISSTINEQERGRAIGTWSAFTTLVTIGGPILGGALADAGLWRFIFFINLPIGIVALVILWQKVQEIKNADVQGRLDAAGAAAIALGLALLTFGLLRLPAGGIKSWQVCAPLLAGVGLLGAFIVIERRSRYPMMPLQLFANKTFSGVNLLSFFLYAGLGAGMLFLPLNMVQVQGYSQMQTGLTFLPFTLLMILLARYAGSLADRYGPRLFLITGPATAALGLLLLSLVKQTHGAADYWTTFFPGILVFGLGISFTVAPLTTAVMGSVSDHLSGTASGVNNAVTRIANVFANAVFGALAVLLFSGALQHQLRGSSLSAGQQQAVMQQAANLGDAHVPVGTDDADRMVIETAYHTSFIDTYAIIMRCSAVLALCGAVMSFVFVRNGEVKSKK